MSKCCFTLKKLFKKNWTIGWGLDAFHQQQKFLSFCWVSITSLVLQTLCTQYAMQSSNPCALSTQHNLTLVRVFPANWHYLITDEVLHGLVIVYQFERGQQLYNSMACHNILFYAVSKWAIRDLVKAILTESNRRPKKAAGMFISNTTLRNR